MIVVQLNKRDFEYDIHSLIRAFYPGVDVTVFQEGETAPEEYEYKLEVNYFADRIEMIWKDTKGEVLASDSREVQYEKDRKETKNVLKRALYDVLSELPVKIFRGEI